MQMQASNKPEIDQNMFFKKSLTRYECTPCQFTCCKSSELQRHIATSKHIRLSLLAEGENVIKTFLCEECKKIYKSKQALDYHNIKCFKKKEVVVESSEKDEIHLKTLIAEILKNNAALQQQNQDLQKTVMEVLQKLQVPTTNINNNNNNNKTTTFNMQVFLNEHCKDAMNLKEFVDKIQPTVADLEMVGEKGFVDGLTNIIVTSLRATETHLRPIHCSDVKRTVMYVKENDKWEKDGPQNEKVQYMVKNVEYKNIRQLSAYGAEHPDCFDSESPTNDYYLTLSQIATSGTDEKVEKVIIKIANEVQVDKIIK
jgi:hypothetical protein